MKNFGFFESKKFFYLGPVDAKIFISWWMMGECTGYHVQKEWNFYLAVQARNKFFTVLTIGKWSSMEK